jgi:two-component system response regulator RegX3
MPGKTLVLVVDDDTRILDLLAMSLQRDGFDVLTAVAGEQALKLAYKEHPDAIILDVMLPGMDGFEVCRRLREMTEAVIIFVTARDETEDVVRGLRMGGDDYIIKPYAYQELVTRLAAGLRRRATGSLPPVLKSSGDVLMLTDPGRRLVFMNGQAIQLTPKEFEVLKYLIKNSGKVLSSDAILRFAWGAEYIGESRLLKQCIYRLRAKLEPNPSRPVHILTVRGSGYVFEPEPLAVAAEK